MHQGVLKWMRRVGAMEPSKLYICCDAQHKIVYGANVIGATACIYVAISSLCGLLLESFLNTRGYEDSSIAKPRLWTLQFEFIPDELYEISLLPALV